MAAQTSNFVAPILGNLHDLKRSNGFIILGHISHGEEMDKGSEQQVRIENFREVDMQHEDQIIVLDYWKAKRVGRGRACGYDDSHAAIFRIHRQRMDKGFIEFDVQFVGYPNTRHSNQWMNERVIRRANPDEHDRWPAFAQLNNPPAPPPLPPLTGVNTLEREQERERQRRGYRDRQTSGVAFLDSAWNGPDWIPADVRLGLGSVGLPTPAAKVVKALEAITKLLLNNNISLPSTRRPGQAPARLHLSGKTAESVLKSLQEQYPKEASDNDDQSIAASTEFSFNPGNDYSPDNESEPEVAPSESDIFFDALSQRGFSLPPDTTNTNTMAETEQPAPALKRNHNEFAKDMGCNEESLLRAANTEIAAAEAKLSDAQVNVRELEIAQQRDHAHKKAREQHCQSLVDEVNQDFPEREGGRRHSMGGLAAIKARADLATILYHIEEAAPSDRDLVAELEAANAHEKQCSGHVKQAKTRLSSLNNMWAAKLKLEEVAEQEEAEGEIQAKIEKLRKQLEMQRQETANKRGEAAEAMMAQLDEDWAGILDLRE
ncbi:hypothetical protein ACHAPU_010798 [Fusarium lateritium]